MSDQQPQAVTPKLALELRNAIIRLRELNGAKILTKESDKEKAALSEFIVTNMGRHANEFVGCWFGIHNEYEPMVAAFSNFLQRVSFFNQSNQPAPAAAPESNQGGNVEAK